MNITVNGQGIPDIKGMLYAPTTPPEGMQHPVWRGLMWEDSADSYVSFEKLETQQRLKDERAVAISRSVVTTVAGNTFDGNEGAQNRMSRAVNAMDEADTLPWVLADNTIAFVTRAELKEALRLAGLAMSEIWVQPYLTEQNT